MSLVLLAGCATPRRAVRLNTAEKETIKINTHYEIVPVYVKVAIPAISDKQIVRDSSSHLENDYATSDARILTDGSLYHDLKTKPQELKSEAEAEVQVKDTVIYRDRIVTEVVEEEVEKELSFWQETKLKGFWILLLMLAFAYRDKLVAFVRLFI